MENVNLANLRNGFLSAATPPVSDEREFLREGEKKSKTKNTEWFLLRLISH